MAKLIEIDEAMLLLRQNIRHYLWNKPIRNWSENDVKNLRAGKNINYGNIMREKYNTKGQPIEITAPDGEKIIVESVSAAAKVTKLQANAIYTVVNGRYAKTNNFKFVKV